MEKSVIKRIIVEKQQEIPALSVADRGMQFEEGLCYVLIGPRRAGKSYMLYRDIQHKIASGAAVAEDMLYVNFEDERMASIRAEELGLVLDAYKELYDRKPFIYLDEIQNIIGWEKFARRLADSKYRVMITGSNARMLSKDISTTLGGRYVPREVFPFSFAEYLPFRGLRKAPNWEYDTAFCTAASREFDTYLHWGGFCETFDIQGKREWLNALYQKVLMGDIVERNKIRNPGVFRLLVRKLAESVLQPCAMNRLKNIIKSSGESISDTVLKDYLGYLEDAYLTFSLSNYVSPLTEKETIRKRYFIDNGILALFLVDEDEKLLENLVAIQLNRLYRNTKEETRLYYYNRGCEIDFCIPEERLAIQVSCEITNRETYEREVGGLEKFLAAYPDYRGILITADTERSIASRAGDIKVVPAWKWLLERAPLVSAAGAVDAAGSPGSGRPRLEAGIL